MKNSFILHHDTLSVINELTDEQTGQLIKEIYSYSIFLNNPKEAKKPTGLIGLMNSVLHPFKMQLDRDFDKYLSVLERNSKNGAKGGRPTKVENPKKPKKAVSDSVNVNDSDSVKENKSLSIVKNDDATRIANYLHLKIVSRKPNFKKPSIDAWAKDIDLAMRIDKRTSQELKGCIDWIYTSNGSFWIPNIMSGRKLREKFDTMESQMQSTKSAVDNIYDTGLSANDIINEAIKRKG